MPIKKEFLEQILKDSFPQAIIVVTDTVGDEDHYHLDIKYNDFKGKNLVEQHKMVNKALKEHLGTTLHALSMKTSV